MVNDEWYTATSDIYNLLLDGNIELYNTIINLSKTGHSIVMVNDTL